MYGWIAAGAILVAILACPLDIFVAFILQTREKIEITETLIHDLTALSKAGLIFVLAVLAVLMEIFVFRKKR